jgi:hypothetical protein
LEAPSAQAHISGFVVSPHYKKVRWRCRSSSLRVTFALAPMTKTNTKPTAEDIEKWAKVIKFAGIKPE